MLYLFSRQSLPPKSEPIGREISGANGGILEAACGKNTYRIPDGLEVPDFWRDPNEYSRCGPPIWMPKFMDDKDIESRLDKDIEDFTPEEFDIFKQTEDFGIYIRQ